MNRAIEINPNNVAVTGDAGWGHICVGEYEKGLEYLLDATTLNPYYPWYFNMGFCFYYFHLTEFDEVLFYAQRINRQGFYWDPLLKASALGSLGRIEEAAPYVEQILAIKPDFTKRAMEIIGLFLLDEELKQTILTGLIKAGLSVANAPDTEGNK